MVHKRLTLMVAVLALLSVALVAKNSLARHSVLDQLNLLVNVRHELDTFYVEETEDGQLVDAAVRGMVHSLDDPYTEYYSKEELADFDKEVHGEFSGIGAEINVESGKLQITSPLEDSPAWEAGVLAGDIVLEIDGTEVEKIFVGHQTRAARINAAIDHLTGQPGTKVTLRVRHKTGEEENITITRKKIVVPTVKGVRRLGEDGHWDYMLDPARRIGYIRLMQFTDKSIDDVRLAVEQLKGEGVRGLILDLRFNPGGLLTGAVDLSDMFLEEGKRIVSIRGRGVGEQVYRAKRDDSYTDIPLVVLANEFSASASEIVTGALADNGRAKFIGTRTFGKGSVQTTKLMTDDKQQPMGMLKFTTAYYYLPNGRNIHRKPDAELWGVDPEPGFYVSMSAEQMEEMIKVRREGDVLRRKNGNGPAETITPAFIEEKMADPQLAAALKALLGKLKVGDWPKVGRDNVQQLALQTRRDNLERQREFFQESLTELETELAKLDEQINEAGGGESGSDADDSAGVEKDKAAEELEPAGVK